MTPDEWEQATIRQMLIGALALDLPPEAFEVLRDIAERNSEKRKAA